MAGESQQVPRSMPDPTVLTTEQLLRETDSLRELLEAEIETVRSLHGEKFRSVDDQLALIERQRVEQKADTKAAVDAALTAQKEAVKEQTAATDKAIAKTEASTAEQLKQQSVTSATSVSGVVSSLNDVKDRLTRLESGLLGRTEQRTEHRASSGAVYAAVTLGLSLVLAALTILGFIIANSS